MKASRIYTAQEMRDVAQCLHYNSPSELTIEAAAMLRQSVEMRERAEEVRARHSLYYGKVDYENETAIVDEVDYILRGAEGKE